MEKKLQWKVKTGYGALDFILIDESELEKVKLAQITKAVVTLGVTQIKGSEIKSIEPDYHHHTGWNRSYQPSTYEDELQIKRDVPMELYQEKETEANKNVQLRLHGDKIKKLK